MARKENTARYVLGKTNTAISSCSGAVQPLFIPVSPWSSGRCPGALLSRVGAEFSLQRDVVLQSSQAVAVCREREQELHPYPRERTGLKDPWVYFPAPPQHVINVIALRFLKSLGGGGKIYFKLLSLLVRVLFVMYFCLQHVVIQLTLLDVT